MRRSNEDRFAHDDDHGIYVVADGVSQGARGDLAAEITVKAVCDSVAATAGARQSEDRLEEAIWAAHTQIRAAVRRDDTLHAMATTVVALLLDRDKDSAVISHMGDSRCYRLRGTHLECLTRDHTMATEMLDSGVLTSEEMEGNRLHHVLTRALAFDGGADVETTVTSLERGDIFLLCSDGLSNMLSERAIQIGLAGGVDPAEACRRLIQAALLSGGHDNVTVVAIEIA